MLTTEKYVFRSVGQNRIGCNSDDLEILAGPKFISQGGYGNSYGRSEEADYISLGPIRLWPAPWGDWANVYVTCWGARSYYI